MINISYADDVIIDLDSHTTEEVEDESDHRAFTTTTTTTKGQQRINPHNHHDIMIDDNIESETITTTTNDSPLLLLQKQIDDMNEFESNSISNQIIDNNIMAVNNEGTMKRLSDSVRSKESSVTMSDSQLLLLLEQQKQEELNEMERNLSNSVDNNIAVDEGMKRIWGSSDSDSVARSKESGVTTSDSQLLVEQQLEEEVNELEVNVSNQVDNTAVDEGMKRLWGSSDSDPVRSKDIDSVTKESMLKIQPDISMINTEGLIENDKKEEILDLMIKNISKILLKESIIESIENDSTTSVDNDNDSNEEKIRIMKEVKSEQRSEVDNNTKEDGKRLWGSTTAPTTTTSQDNMNVIHAYEVKHNRTHDADDKRNVSNETVESINQQQNKQHQQHSTIHPHIPFVAATSKSQSTNYHNPPEGFSLKARVYIDSNDAMAHFDYNLDNNIDSTTNALKQQLTIPYWDCGVTGSTTSPIRLKDAYFRNAMGCSTSWNGGTDPLHPTLAIALTSCFIELNSGESMEIESGDIILLEDTIRPGHKFSPLLSFPKNNNKANEIKILFITLPQHHYHAGKEHLSLKEAITMTNRHPCPDITTTTTNTNQRQRKNEFQRSVDTSTSGIIKNRSLHDIIFKQSKLSFWNAKRIRYIILGTIGLSISTLIADFIGRTAPLWLAAGIGGIFVVGFGTYGFTLLSNQLISDIQLWYEKRNLLLSDDYNNRLLHHDQYNNNDNNNETTTTTKTENDANVVDIS